MGTYAPTVEGVPQYLRDSAAALNAGVIAVSTTAGNLGTSANITQPYSAATNGAGNYNGTGNPQTLFTVSGGNVLLAIIAVCNTTLTGASATLEVGNATTATRYLPQITGTNFTKGKTWDITGLVTAGTVPNTTPNQVAFSGETVLATVGTANITAGNITYYAFWVPLTPGATVTASAPITA